MAVMAFLQPFPVPPAWWASHPPPQSPRCRAQPGLLRLGVGPPRVSSPSGKVSGSLSQSPLLFCTSSFLTESKGARHCLGGGQGIDPKIAVLCRKLKPRRPRSGSNRTKRKTLAIVCLSLLPALSLPPPPPLSQGLRPRGLTLQLLSFLTHFLRPWQPLL